MRIELKSVRIAFAIVIAIGSLAGGANAAVTFSFEESGGLVVLTVTGTINLAATSGIAGVSQNTSTILLPATGAILAGPSSFSDFYSITVGAWTSYGIGSSSPLAVSESGDRIALFSNPFIGLPTGYLSGSNISATNTWSGSFATLGLTPGSYTTSFNNGANSDSVTVNVNAVPEPSSSALFLGIGALGIVAHRRRIT